MRRGGIVVKGLIAFAVLLATAGLGFHPEAARG
jgi:hypothetical protein